MEPTVGDTVGVGSVPSGQTPDRSDHSRTTSSGTGSDADAKAKWGIRRYDGFYTTPINDNNIAYIIGLARELHGLGTLASVPFDWNHCMAVMRAATKSPIYFVRMANNGEYCGAVVGHTDSFFFSPKLMATENAWFVREGTPYRAKIAGTLMREFVDWAMNDKQCDHVQCGDIANINTMGVDALYRRLGFKRYGAIYQYGGYDGR